MMISRKYLIRKQLSQRRAGGTHDGHTTSATPPTAPNGDELTALLAELKLSKFLPKTKEEGCAFVSDLEDLSVEELMAVFGMEKLQAKWLAKKYLMLTGKQFQHECGPFKNEREVR